MIEDLIRDARVRRPQSPGSPDEQLRQLLRARLRLLGVMVGACLLVLPILAVGTWLVHLPTTAGAFFHTIGSALAEGNSPSVASQYVVSVVVVALSLVLAWTAVLRPRAARKSQFLTVRVLLIIPAVVQAEMFGFIFLQSQVDLAKAMVAILVSSTLVAFSYASWSVLLLRRANRFEAELKEAHKHMQVVDKERIERAREERRSKDLA